MDKQDRDLSPSNTQNTPLYKGAFIYQSNNTQQASRGIQELKPKNNKETVEVVAGEFYHERLF